METMRAQARSAAWLGIGILSTLFLVSHRPTVARNPTEVGELSLRDVLAGRLRGAAFLIEFRPYHLVEVGQDYFAFRAADNPNGPVEYMTFRMITSITHFPAENKYNIVPDYYVILGGNSAQGIGKAVVDEFARSPMDINLSVQDSLTNFPKSNIRGKATVEKSRPQ